ncbi:hypothetical protein B7486_06705 [cyanobacterium TDX16]|nr:hypothetical protein B7486_06705 [cyanobacterium TDX16]
MGGALGGDFQFRRERFDGGRPGDGFGEGDAEEGAAFAAVAASGLAEMGVGGVGFVGVGSLAEFGVEGVQIGEGRVGIVEIDAEAGDGNVDGGVHEPLLYRLINGSPATQAR